MFKTRKIFCLKGQSRLYILSLSFIFISLTTLAQNHFVFFPISGKDGLSDNQVRCMGQLSDGRMVVVTEGLVNLYNGTSFKYLHFNDAVHYQLNEYSGFHRLYIDNNNKLWVKNQHSLMLFDAGKEVFEPDIDSVLNKMGIIDHIADLYMDTEYGYWFLTDENRLLHRSPKGTVSQFLTSVTQQNTNKDKLYDIAVSNKQLFLFYKSGLMCCYDISTKTFLYEHNPLKEEGPFAYQNTLMVVPSKYYLYQIRNGRSGGILLRYNVRSRLWEKILQQNYILNTLSIDNEGSCFVSTRKGFWVINHSLSEKKYIPELSLEDGRIFETEISTQYNDRNGGLWIGTVNRGMLYYHPNRFIFRNFGRSFFHESTVKNLSVKCFAEWENMCFIGTNMGLFNLTKNGSSIQLNKELPPDINCNAIMKDSHQRIWVCTDQSGVYRIDKNIVQHYPINTGCLYLHETIDGKYLLSTHSGMQVFSPEKQRFKEFNIFNKGHINSVRQIIDYNNDSFLGITRNEIFVYNRKNDRFSTLTKNNQKELSFHLSNHQYNCILLDSHGLIWIGTKDGLNAWDGKNDLLYSLHTEDGLVNNSVQSIIEDDEQHLWVSTANGISKIEMSKKEEKFIFSFTNYNYYDGVIRTEFQPRSVYKTNDGNLLWGGLDGFNIMDINQLGKYKRPLGKPYFEKLFITGSEIKQGVNYDGRIILEQSLSTTNTLNLKYSQNFIRFEFSALNFVNASRTYYRYQLEGYDDTKHEITATNGIGVANYTNLPPGNYLLKVYASNNSNEWSDKYSEISIIIHPPVWKSAYAYFAYALFLIIAFYLSIYFLLKQNKRKIAREQITALDQMKFSFFTNVSHELRTPLSLIITPLNSILRKTDNPSLKKQLSGISKNANELLKLVNQLLDFRKLEMRGEHLQLSYCNIGEFLSSICLSFDDLLGSKKINFSWNFDGIIINTFVDKDKLQKIVNNLLSNALKFTPAEGSISIVLSKLELPGHDNRLAFKIEIQDTGCGISENDLTRIFNRFYQVKKVGEEKTGSGIGLHMVKEYVQLHQGEISVTSRLHEGSLFSVYIPLDLHPDNQPQYMDDTLDANLPQKILVVEDNDEFRNFLKEELSEHYSIITAVNGKEGLQKALEYSPDLVISDFSMPVMSGFELCQSLKKNVHISHIPFIILTARTSDLDQIDGFQAGADAYITKPFNMEILLLRIQKLIGLQEQRKSLFKKAIAIHPENLTLTSLDEELIKKALACIEKNMNNQSYSIDQFSKDMYMDRTSLFRKLKAIVGQTPSAFLRSVRLKRSAIMLEKGLPVSEVSDLVGFGSVSYFSKCFHEEFGMKPSHWEEKGYKS